MHWEDVRRITGRHPLQAVAGAGMELIAAPLEVADELVRVRQRIHNAWIALGWPPAVLHARRHAAGLSLTVEAPADQLYAAADALEWASEHAVFDTELLAARDREARPRLRAWLAGPLPAFYDDDETTLGLGRTSHTWPHAEIDQVDLDTLTPAPAAIPFVYVTGTNGKTTTTRLLARIVKEAGYTVGHTSSDGVVIDGEWATRGDWTGPGAARAVLRHADVSFALLETARGGLMRRGLVLDGADGALVTNISDDHLGEWGLHTLDEMAWAKLTVAHAVREGGVVVINGDNAPLQRAAKLLAEQRPDLTLVRFGDAPRDDLDAWFQDGALWLRRQGVPTRWIDAKDVPITLDGAARHNVANALSASLLALHLGLPEDAIRRGLTSFRPTLAESRGRLNRFRLPSGGTAIVDFAHNPDGVRHLATVAEAYRPCHVSLVTGQAGDRPDELLQRLAQAVAHVKPDVALVKELNEYRRGREEGEVGDRLVAGLIAEGIPVEAIQRFDQEIDACLRAVALTGEGDLALLVVHEDVDGVVDALLEMGAVEA
jgi:cyanophycin synthetase